MPTFPTPQQSFESVIDHWEGLWEDDPRDAGNWAHCHDGTRKLIGTMRGVTPDTYARYLGIDPAELTPERMQAEITLEVAADVGMKLFYFPLKLNLLTWSPLAAIVTDFAWGSGEHAIVSLQQLVGAADDGRIGPQTAALVDRYLDDNPIDAASDRLTALRIDFYKSISQPGSRNAEFRQGWINRADWFLSTNRQPCWWDAWAGWKMTAPVSSARRAA